MIVFMMNYRNIYEAVTRFKIQKRACWVIEELLGSRPWGAQQVLEGRTGTGGFPETPSQRPNMLGFTVPSVSIDAFFYRI